MKRINGVHFFGNLPAVFLYRNQCSFSVLAITIGFGEVNGGVNFSGNLPGMLFLLCNLLCGLCSESFYAAVDQQSKINWKESGSKKDIETWVNPIELRCPFFELCSIQSYLTGSRFNCTQTKFAANILVLSVISLCDFSLDQFFVLCISLLVLKNGINR